MEVAVQNLAKTWDGGGTQFVALDPVSHRFPSGRFTCLLGPSGCGKSTLVKLIGGLETPSAGTLQIIDPPAGAQSEYRPSGGHSAARRNGVGDDVAELESLRLAQRHRQRCLQPRGQR